MVDRARFVEKLLQGLRESLTEGPKPAADLAIFFIREQLAIGVGGEVQIKFFKVHKLKLPFLPFMRNSRPGGGQYLYTFHPQLQINLLPTVQLFPLCLHCFIA